MLTARCATRAARRLCAGTPARAADVARYLVGRGATDADKAARVTIVPIPSIDHPRADMMIRRLAVYVPQPCPVRTDDLAWAIGQVTWPGANGTTGRELQPANDDAMAPRYETTGRHWQSVTPLALAGARRSDQSPASGPEARGTAERRSVGEGEGPGRPRRTARPCVTLAVRYCPVSVTVQCEPSTHTVAGPSVLPAGPRFPGDVPFACRIDVRRTGFPARWCWETGANLGLGLIAHRRSDALACLAFAIEGGLAAGRSCARRPR